MPRYIRLEDHAQVDRNAVVESYEKLLYIGEVHEQEWLVEEVTLLLGEACEAGKLGFLAMEHFNIEQQEILDGWLEDKLSFEELAAVYEKGPEGFNLRVYRPLMEAARDCGARVIGVMPPRDKAQIASRTGSMPWLPKGAPDPRDMSREYIELLSRLFPREGPMARIPVERLLLAQSYKDSIASWRIAEELKTGRSGMVLMGWAHVEVKGAVASRVSALSGLVKPGYRVVGARLDPGELDFYLENKGLVETDYLLLAR
ncbi:MAG: ChaN family lipoprotein [Desulfurococcales archaeon]|nr:ChaN family lipoprotein [Desulfurococcales archaeon]